MMILALYALCSWWFLLFKRSSARWEIIHFKYRLTIKSIEEIVQFWQWHDLEPILSALFNCKLSPFLFAREFPISEIHYWSSQPFFKDAKVSTFSWWPYEWGSSPKCIRPLNGFRKVVNLFVQALIFQR